MENNVGGLYLRGSARHRQTATIRHQSRPDASVMTASWHATQEYTEARRICIGCGRRETGRPSAADGETVTARNAVTITDHSADRDRDLPAAHQTLLTDAGSAPQRHAARPNTGDERSITKCPKINQRQNSLIVDFSAPARFMVSCNTTYEFFLFENVYFTKQRQQHNTIIIQQRNLT